MTPRRLEDMNSIADALAWALRRIETSRLGEGEYFARAKELLGGMTTALAGEMPPLPPHPEEHRGRIKWTPKEKGAILAYGELCAIAARTDELGTRLKETNEQLAAIAARPGVTR